MALEGLYQCYKTDSLLGELVQPEVWLGVLLASAGAGEDSSQVLFTQMMTAEARIIYFIYQGRI